MKKNIAHVLLIFVILVLSGCDSATFDTDVPETFKSSKKGIGISYQEMSEILTEKDFFTIEEGDVEDVFTGYIEGLAKVKIVKNTKDEVTFVLLQTPLTRTQEGNEYLVMGKLLMFMKFNKGIGLPVAEYKECLSLFTRAQLKVESGVSKKEQYTCDEKKIIVLERDSRFLELQITHEDL